MKSPGGAVDPYHSHSFAELCRLDTAFRDGLFEDQVVLITGGAGGIGTAMSVLFGRLGATVVATGRDPEKLERLQSDLASIDVPVHTFVMTVREPEEVEETIDSIWDRCGRLDHVINNAGGQFSAAAVDITPKGWNAVVETNLYGTWYTMQSAARRWIDADQPGNIINISTIQGRASVGIVHTAAARAGGVAITRSLAVEWAPHGIRVNSIAVGVIASEGLLNYPPEAKGSFGHNPMRHLGDVWDVAQGAVYLAGPTGNFVTGTHLEITGGEHVWGEYWPLGKPAYFRTESD
ncbi:MAG: SDR family oxidoreductase [Actinomycetota bacterium]|nr:SDR family oxidoreductase [Actinomycetota bacterium]